MGLSNYQLVLLDNLIYLKSVFEYEVNNVKGLINYLLHEKDENTGKYYYQLDAIDPNSGGKMCFMDEDEWKDVLEAIERDSTLCSLTIHDVTEDETTGFRAATLIGEDENVVIFAGTLNAYSWMDDAEGGYSSETVCQKQALDYVNSINIANGNSFTVSGQSKGGNLAMYAALFATNPVIDHCLSYDGQGFSEELVGQNEFQDRLERNARNIYSISSAGDCVNVLFNSPVPPENQMYVEGKKELFPLFYHIPNNIFLYEDGRIVGLRESTGISAGAYFFREFMSYISKTETDVDRMGGKEAGGGFLAKAD